jgi:hypothetical protein
MITPERKKSHANMHRQETPVRRKSDRDPVGAHTNLTEHFKTHSRTIIPAAA